MQHWTKEVFRFMHACTAEGMCELRCPVAQFSHSRQRLQTDVKLHACAPWRRPVETRSPTSAGVDKCQSTERFLASLQVARGRVSVH
jgi:hypothetical protein